MTNGASKKVALFVPSLHGGGAERVTVTLANGFSRAGVKVDLLLAETAGPYLGDVSPAVRVFDLRARRVAASIPKLAYYLRDERPDAVLSAQYHANVAITIAYRLASSTARLVLVEHTTPTHSQSRSLRDRLVKATIPFIYPRADAVVGVSRGVVDSLATLGVPRDKMRVIYNPIVCEHMLAMSEQECEHPWLQDGAVPVFVSVGRLEPDKDFENLLRAFYIVRMTVAARLLVLGEGRLRSKLESFARSLGISNDVQFIGFRSNPFPYMRRANTFVLASRWEGFGNVIVEAMAFGTPVVSTNCAGPAELLDGGRLGLLVAVGRPESLACALLQAIAVPRVSAEIALERVAKYSVQTSVGNYLDALALK